MILLTEEQKKRIRGEIGVLSETISDLGLIVDADENRGGIRLASDNYRDSFGVDLLISCPIFAEKYVAAAFMEFGINIRKPVLDSIHGLDREVLGLTLSEYKGLLKGSIIIALEYQKELARRSPEGIEVKFKIQMEFADILKRFTTSPEVEQRQTQANSKH